MVRASTRHANGTREPMLISERRHETKFPRDASRREVSNLWLYFTHVLPRLPTVSPPLFLHLPFLLFFHRARRRSLNKFRSLPSSSRSSLLSSTFVLGARNDRKVKTSRGRKKKISKRRIDPSLLENGGMAS